MKWIVYGIPICNVTAFVIALVLASYDLPTAAHCTLFGTMYVTAAIAIVAGEIHQRQQQSC